LLARVILLIGVATLTLFAIGPLAGSVDDDGDGSPDIPIVVSGPVLFADLSGCAGIDQRSDSIQHGALSGHFRSSSLDGKIIEAQFLSVDAGAVLSSLCSLRC
jgi:hypothetical protein